MAMHVILKFGLASVGTSEALILTAISQLARNHPVQ
jgi:hypothetical protein